MAEKYTSELLGVVIAQIAQTIGYSRTQTAPLELLEDILQRFIHELARDLHSQAEHATRNEPNLKDALLSLKNLNINVQELLDYIGNVEPIPFIRDIPAYPVKRNSNMNFLKPGSAETLTRPVHIFEYLPPMLPTETTLVSTAECPDKTDHEQGLGTLEVTRDAGNKASVKSLQDFPVAGFPKWCKNESSVHSSVSRDLDHDGHGIREISSVVMTTGGFISPAIEGKLPETFVPDIIEKFKGLDAPTFPVAPETPEAQHPFKKTDAIDIVIQKQSESSESTLRSMEKGPSCSETNLLDDKNESNTTSYANTTFPLLSVSKPTKKSKKKNMVANRQHDQTSDLNAIKAQEKAHRKVLKMYQRLSKSQGGVEGDSNIFALKKSIKNLNRGMLAALPDGAERMQLEKLIKKQTKQRQKHLKSQKQHKQLQSASKLIGDRPNVVSLVSHVNNDPETSMDPMNSIAEKKLDFLSQPQIEKIDTRSLNIAIPAKTIPESLINADYQPDEIKLASEPDKIKLNIFKKISKQKIPKLSPSTLNMNSNIYDSAGHGSPLITLPSGTTITPAPAMSSSESGLMSVQNMDMTFGNINTYVHSLGNLPTIAPTAIDVLSIDTNKPKKRGRKPGGKNQPKPSGGATISPISIQSPKKVKSSKTNSVFPYMPDGSMNTNSTILPNLPIPLEPLNLSNFDTLKDSKFSNNVGLINDFGAGSLSINAGGIANEINVESSKVQKSKEKKERKKSKVKISSERDDNFQDSVLVDCVRDVNKKFGFMDSGKSLSKNVSPSMKTTNDSTTGAERNLQILTPKLPIGNKNKDPSISPHSVGTHGFAPIPGSTNLPLPISTTMHPSNPSNMMPILPLLHFPPRPGLIPSGPALFPPATLSAFNKTVSCGTGSNMIMPHSFLPFSSGNRSGTISQRPSIIETSENKSNLLGMTPLTDANMERSYCNVAPLVPESMKLTPLQIDTKKSRSPDHIVYDTKLNSDCGMKDITQVSKIMPMGQGLIQCGTAETQLNKTLTTKLTKPITATGNLGDPIEVSDDSTDDDVKEAKKKATGNVSHTFGLKTNLIQSSNILSADPQQQLEISHSTLLHSPIPDTKQLKKTLKVPSKMAQPDNNLLNVGPASQSSAFNLNYIGNDKFCLAGGADLIPLSRVDSGLAYSSQTIPSTSLAAGATSGSISTHAAPESDEHNFINSVNYDDITITPANNNSISDPKTRKLHKKLKKPKEGKIKKKKDKKDKIKNKEKSNEKYVLNMEKTKSQDKKPKKDKKKEKQVLLDGFQISMGNIDENLNPPKNVDSSSSSLLRDVSPSSMTQAMVTHHLVPPKLDISPNQVPKITLKISGKSTPTPSSLEGEHSILESTPPTPSQSKREHSPELARFSPLVTGPPKPKQCETQTQNVSMSTPASAFPPVSKSQTMAMLMSISNTQNTSLSAPSSGWMSCSAPTASSTISASSVLLPQQLLPLSKQITKMPVPSVSTNFASISSTTPKKPESTLSVPQNSEVNRPSSYVDAEGYRIWICPACGKVDDGSPMIGCDGCDAWYHWTCVGILVPPNDNEDWFCRVCITKKKISGSEKKKKRNKKK